MAGRLGAPGSWPTPAADLGTTRSDPRVLVVAGEVLAGIRGAKTAAQVSMRAEVAKVEVSGPAEQLVLARRAEEDLRAAGRIVGEIVWASTESDSIAVVATL